MYVCVYTYMYMDTYTCRYHANHDFPRVPFVKVWKRREQKEYYDDDGGGPTFDRSYVEGLCQRYLNGEMKLRILSEEAPAEHTVEGLSLSLRFLLHFVLCLLHTVLDWIYICMCIHVCALLHTVYTVHV